MVNPMVLIQDALDTLEGCTYFSSIDMNNAYYQLDMKEEDRSKTAFITQDGLFEFKRIPFEAKNAPASSSMLPFLDSNSFMP